MQVIERGKEGLDQEWMALIMEAKEIGLGTDLVRDFLSRDDRTALMGAE
ncbi:anti-repressor SinI family protein [Bacillus sp. FJAT-27445]|nr:anti-repressor SinI family protein [Bacillus sp. FJAT-27445]